MLKASHYRLLGFIFAGVFALHGCHTVSNVSSSSKDTSISSIDEVISYDSTYFQGKWGGYLVQDVYDFPFAMRLEGKTMTLDIPALGIDKQSFNDVSYEEEFVKITADDQVMLISPAGEDSVYVDVPFAEGSRALLARGKDRPELNRPQAANLSDSYTSVPVEFKNDDHDIVLSGTLSGPAEASSVVIFLSGSGPSDRDETIFGHKPFAVIADYLSSRGVTVLRYDDRGVGESTGSQVGSTSFDFAMDAKAAYNFVKDSLGDIPIGFLGHSEGGIIAQVADSLVGGVSFHIYLASPGLDIIDLMVEQNRLFLADKIGVEQANIYASGLKGVFAAVVSDLDRAAKQDTINRRAKTLYNQLDPEQAKKVAPSDIFYAMNMNALQSNVWMQYFLSYQPSQYLSKIKCPILAINGSKDIQVIPENLGAIQELATLADVTAIEFPNLNHLMQHCITGQVKEYALISETINPAVLDTMVSWLSDKGWAE